MVELLTVKKVMAIDVELLNVPVPSKEIDCDPRVSVLVAKLPVLPKVESIPIARVAEVAAEKLMVSLPEPNPK